MRLLFHQAVVAPAAHASQQIGMTFPDTPVLGIIAHDLLRLTILVKDGHDPHPALLICGFDESKGGLHTIRSSSLGNPPLRIMSKERSGYEDRRSVWTLVCGVAAAIVMQSRRVI